MSERLTRRPGWRRGGNLDVVELLVVVIIVGVLAVVMIHSLSGFSEESQTSACAADTRSLHSAEEANYAQMGSYDTQAALVTHGLLSRVSVLHSVALTPADSDLPAVDYRIMVRGSHCGRIGDEVGQTARDR